MSVSLLDEADLYRWRVLMDGPPGSLYAVRVDLSNTEERGETDQVSSGWTFQTAAGVADGLPLQATVPSFRDEDISSQRHQR